MNIKIGERLEEARKRQNINIEAAAQATKIRGDFLINFEKDNFDFNLPEIYMLGFLKNYARYLKLDAEKIAADFNALRLRPTSSTDKKEFVRDTYGKMPLVTPLNPNSAESDTFEAEDIYIPQNPRSIVSMQHLKIGFITLITLLTLGTLIYTLKKFKSQPAAATQSTVQSPNSLQTSTTGQNSAATANNTVILTATGDVQVIVREELGQTRIFSGALKSGEQRTIVRQGPIKIHFSEGSHLIVELGTGEKLKPGRSGVGWFEVN
jgi:cytoskeletal protein RodZ